MTSRQDDDLDCNRLFVYGTLRKGQSLHGYLARLGAKFESQAKVAGELYDLGSYPGARPPGAASSWIQGELFQLHKVESDLKALDEVEEFIPGSPERSQFVREQVTVVLADGGLVTAWIYWLSQVDTKGLRRIESGDYSVAPARSGSDQG